MLYQDKINNLIPQAMEAIEKVGIAQNDEVAGEFEGYIAAFGSNINQSGLLPTLIFYNNDSGKSQKSSLWLKAILYILTKGEQEDNLIRYIIDKTKKETKNNYGISDLNFDKLETIESEIKSIVIALKLAVRTFEIPEKK